jgi:hypothetical protein
MTDVDLTDKALFVKMCARLGYDRPGVRSQLVEEGMDPDEAQRLVNDTYDSVAASGSALVDDTEDHGAQR